jgi:hypothetical protein
MRRNPKMLKSLNNNVVCTAFQTTYNKSKQVGSLSMLGGVIGLAQLEVLARGELIWNNGCGEYLNPGDKVWVRGDAHTAAWAKAREIPEIKDKDGKPIPFIVIPGAEIIFAETGEAG